MTGDGQQGHYKSIWRSEETVRATKNHLFPVLKKGVQWTQLFFFFFSQDLQVT